ncbi:MAG: DUF434 domain-containing protein [Bacteroidales bacterium]|nr:DUF434 domain-containing protein [Bacteroidales bacterium]
MQITDNFRQAMQDYIFLLEKKYPEKTILNLVSTRYALNHFERSILYRGITTHKTAEERKKRLLVLNNSDQKQETRNPEPFPLQIDLFNVLFTIAAYLRGFPVYLSNDGIVRDASESHDCTGWAEHLEKALHMVLQDLEKNYSSRTIFYIDSPMPLCSHFEEIIIEAAKNLKSLIEIIRDESPDHLLRNATEGILATSDSTIIDKSLLRVFDIPRYLLEKRFGAKLLRLDAI